WDLHSIGNEKKIDNFFKNIFQKIPKDLTKLSSILDEIQSYNKEDITTLDDMFKIIGKRFKKDWNLPKIIFKEEQIININNSKGKIPIIDKIVKFKDRKDFEGLTEKKYKEIIEKIDIYAEKNEWDSEVFIDFNEFKENLINYVIGKNLKKTREKLFEIDFNIINAIVDIKLPTDPPREKEELGKLRGEPLLEFMKAFSLLLYTKTKKKADEVDFDSIETTEIRIKITDIIIKENSESEEEFSLLDPWKNICRYMGGIFTYINNAKIFKNSIGEKIEISFDNSLNLVENEDFFYKDNYKELMDKKVLKKLGDEKTYSSIEFTLTASRNGIEDKKMEFEYQFLPNELWTQEFSYFDEIINKMETSSYLPILSSNTLNNFLYVNDEEEFVETLINCKIEENGNFISQIAENINKSNEFDGKFMILGKIFKDLVALIENNGFYKILSQNENNKILNFIDKYNELAIKLRDSDLSSNKQVISYFINQFMVFSTKECFFEIGTIKTALSLSLHPAMLEKSYDKNRFLVDSFKECIDKIVATKMKKSKNQRYMINKIERMLSFSTISSSVDILPKTSLGNYSEAGYSYGMYTFFKNDLNLKKKFIMSLSNLSRQDAIMNEDVSEKQFAKSSSYSKIIFKTIKQYLNLFTPMADGLELLFINPYSLQHIVAGLEEFMKSKDSEEIV
ncbi:MAG: hypothetical protein ACRC0V_11980, partial [Fusobacteriaceae bacterium]